MGARRNWMTDEQYRAHAREQKRRQRLKRYAKGLNSNGKPLDAQHLATSAARRVFGPHPDGCPCYDCLYPTPAPGAADELARAEWERHRTCRRVGSHI